MFTQDRGDRFANLTAVVIGGGQTRGATIGNGRAAALMYGRNGARVLVADRSLAAAEETAEAIRSEGSDAVAVVADVTSPRDLNALVDVAQDRFGKVDILHNNVGILLHGSTEELSLEHWRRTVDVNLTGMWQSCRAFLPALRAGGKGAIVNISSLAGLIAAGQAIAYSTTKAAVNAMTRSLALEYAPHGVRINCIAPGAIMTPLGVEETMRATGQTRDAVVDLRDRAVPMGRQGTARDVANAARFLASDEAAFITGVVLPVDGGASLGTVPPTASGRQNK